jgi:hypothetical protein
MLSDDLRSGFALAHQRPGLILLDVLWKGIWVALTMVAVFLAAVWISTDLRSIAWEDTGVRALNAFIAAVLVRDFWNGNRAEIFTMIAVMLLASGIAWMFLEAFFRRKILRDLYVVAGFSPRSAQEKGRGLKPATTYAFKFLKDACLFACALAAVLLSLAGASVIAIVTFLSLVFLLSLLDTLIRADAIDLLGTDLFRVAGLLGILMLFELMIGASLVLLLFGGVLRVARPVDAVVMFAAAVVVVLLLNVLHSYLLLVRFSAVAIMRQNVIEV